MPSKTFLGHMDAIVGDFLQTVVVVDDEALDVIPADDPQPNAITSKPGRGGRMVEVETKGSATAQGTDDLDDDTDHGHSGDSVNELDPKVIIDAFAKTGQVCAVLAPGVQEAVEDTVMPVARRADVVILDWVLNGDDGEMTVGLIQAILKADEASLGRRLRAMAIYTGQDNLEEIARKVKEALESRYVGDPLHEDDLGLTLTKGPMRITVLAKGGVTLPGHLSGQSVATSALPERLRAEFASLSAGIVSGVALKSLAALRHDTHRLLHALPALLDHSLLGIRSAQPNPVDVEAQLVDLVAGELRAMLDDHQVGSAANLDCAKLWTKAQEEQTLGRVTIGQTDLEFERAALNTMLGKGLGTDSGVEDTRKKATGVSKTQMQKVRMRATELFAPTKAIARSSDALLAERMAMRTHYTNPPRVLELGTIVVRSGEYLLCVQPLCDSVRISDDFRSFPFLPLRSGVADPDFVLQPPHEPKAAPVRLRIKSNPHALRLLSFEPQPRIRVVAARKQGARFYFRSSQPGSTAQRWWWMGELKREFAQRVAVDLAQGFSRVGLDEHELLRLGRSSS